MTVGFIGHRKITVTDKLKSALRELVESLILNEQADSFLFGSNSEFNDLCYEVVTELKTKYPNIRRIYVRAEYEYINQDYRDYLLTIYEDSFYPAEVHNSGSKAYVIRNQSLIKLCDKLIFYYAPQEGNKSSGTGMAVKFAGRQHKPFYNLHDGV